MNASWAGEIEQMIITALRRRAANGGRHLHHSGCIHNLPPEEQVAIRRRTPEEYVAIHGAMPVQITPADWETEPLPRPAPTNGDPNDQA